MYRIWRIGCWESMNTVTGKKTEGVPKHTLYLFLFYIKHQPLEVLSFRMVNIHRMVARLGKLMEDAHTTSALGCCCKDGIAEVLLVHYLRAREGEEDTARLNLFECLGIELAITTEGIAERVTMLGKGRWVEDNQVVLVTHAVKVLEGIFGISLMAFVAREVKLYILVSQVDGLGRTVYRVYQVGSPTHSIEREAAGVAEHIQYITTL